MIEKKTFYKTFRQFWTVTPGRASSITSCPSARRSYRRHFTATSANTSSGASGFRSTANRCQRHKLFFFVIDAFVKLASVCPSQALPRRQDTQHYEFNNDIRYTHRKKVCWVNVVATFSQ